MDVKLPPLGEGADSGTVVTILVKVGDRVEKGQNVLELENEKAVAGIPSTAGGVVTNIFVKEGDKISVGQKLVALSENGQAGIPEKAGSTPAAKPATPKNEDEEETKVETKADTGPSESLEAAAEPSANAPAGAASPSLRRTARELGIDLGRIRGSERGGRIILADVRAYIEKLQKLASPAKAAPKEPPRPAPARSIDFSQWGPVTKKSLSPLRRTISQRMAESWTTIPLVTQFDEADITSLLAMRKKYAEAFDKAGAHLTLTSFALKVVVAALKKHPIFNSSLDEAAQELVLKNYFHIGIAVDTEAGLIVPVIRDVDKKSLLDLSRELKQLAERTKERKVSIDEMKGGTFTISNQGGIGGGAFTPIVNKPEVAILGLGRGKVKPAVRENKIEPRTLLPLGLSYDHRVIDGGEAARFIQEIVETFEKFPEDLIKI